MSYLGQFDRETYDNTISDHLYQLPLNLKFEH